MIWRSLGWLVLLTLSGAVLSAPTTDYDTVRAQFREVELELWRLQRRTVAGDVALQRQQAALRDVIATEMRARGVDVDGLEAQVERLRQQLRETGLSAAEATRLRERLDSVTYRLRSARDRVLTDPVVRDAKDRYETAVLAAMRREFPEVSSLLQTLRRLQQQMQDRIDAVQH